MDEATQIEFEPPARLMEVDGIIIDLDKEYVPEGAANYGIVDLTFRTSSALHLYEKNHNKMQKAIWRLLTLMPRYMVEKEYVRAAENTLDEDLERMMAEAKEDRAAIQQLIRDEGLSPARGLNTVSFQSLTFSGPYRTWCQILQVIDEVMFMVDGLVIDRRWKAAHRADVFNKWRNAFNRMTRKLHLKTTDGFEELKRRNAEMLEAREADHSNQRNRLAMAKREAAKYRKQKARAQAAQAGTATAKKGSAQGQQKAAPTAAAPQKGAQHGQHTPPKTNGQVSGQQKKAEPTAAAPQKGPQQGQHTSPHASGQAPGQQKAGPLQATEGEKRLAPPNDGPGQDTPRQMPASSIAAA